MDPESIKAYFKAEGNWSTLLSYFKQELYAIYQPQINYIENKYGTYCITELEERNITAEDLRIYKLIGQLLTLSLKEVYKNG